MIGEWVAIGRHSRRLAGQWCKGLAFRSSVLKVIARSTAPVVRQASGW